MPPRFTQSCVVAMKNAADSDSCVWGATNPSSPDHPSTGTLTFCMTAPALSLSLSELHTLMEHGAWSAPGHTQTTRTGCLGRTTEQLHRLCDVLVTPPVCCEPHQLPLSVMVVLRMLCDCAEWNKWILDVLSPFHIQHSSFCGW